MKNVDRETVSEYGIDGSRDLSSLVVYLTLTVNEIVPNAASVLEDCTETAENDLQLASSLTIALMTHFNGVMSGEGAVKQQMSNVLSGYTQYALCQQGLWVETT